MDQIGINSVMQLATKKSKFSKKIVKYGVYSLMAGSFCSIGMAFAYSAGAGFYDSSGVSSLYKLAIGIAFALSFTLIIFAGSELFTGNVFTLTMGSLTKEINFLTAIKVCTFCYTLNLIGAALMGLIIAHSGALDGTSGHLVLEASTAKTTLPFMKAFLKGFMCNVLVCLGIWMVAKIKSEVAKMIALVWVIAGFVAPGYEHSIANGGLFAMTSVLSVDHITVSGILANLVPVSLGNVFGGMFIAFVYWFGGKEE